MPSRTPIDHRGRRIGPFVVIGPAPQKRYWRMVCDHDHVSIRRIDNMLRVREETLTCTECSRKPLDEAELIAAFRIFIETLAPVQKSALGRLLTVSA